MVVAETAKTAPGGGVHLFEPVLQLCFFSCSAPVSLLLAHREELLFNNQNLLGDAMRFSYIVEIKGRIKADAVNLK